MKQLLTSLLIAPAALGATVVYDPSLGTLPDAQGFARIQDPAQANPTVSDGLLHQGLTVFNGIQGWHQPAPSIDFTGSTPFELRARLRVLESTFTADIGDQTHRYGYYFWIGDKNGRRIAFGLATQQVAFDTQPSLGAGNPPPVSMDTSTMRTYRVVASAGRARLFVDGVLTIDTPLGPAGIDPADVFFGDASYAGASNTELEFLSYGQTCPSDLNGDGFVDDADFSIFVIAYNMLDCADPSMPANCPSDFNHDGLVDDADFVIFITAYNELLCP
ncbi:MAG: hypothetical protein U0573_13580 [Phycisphaerales bacterium]|nr:hypothetical protein [Planctomycetota bacterium]